MSTSRRKLKRLREQGIKQRAAVAPPRWEIVRGHTRKVNIGNYESCDFFCSVKTDCSEADALEASAALIAFCKTQNLKEVRELREEQKALAARKGVA